MKNRGNTSYASHFVRSAYSFLLPGTFSFDAACANEVSASKQASEARLERQRQTSFDGKARLERQRQTSFDGKARLERQRQSGVIGKAKHAIIVPIF